MWLLCLKMRAQIWGYLGQMAHRRQIAQWSGTRTAHRRQIAQWAGTRTTHPGGTGFETGVRDRYLPKTRECVSPFPQGLFMPPKNTPQGVSRGKSSVSRRRNPSLAHTAGSTGSTGSTGLVSSSAAQTLPSTRAGGQDDGSYNKLPQTTRPLGKWLNSI